MACLGEGLRSPSASSFHVLQLIQLIQLSTYGTEVDDGLNSSAVTYSVS